MTTRRTRPGRQSDQAACPRNRRRRCPRRAKSELQELTAKNAVQVLQNGKTEHDKGVDIQGELLTLYHFGQKGDILDVYGPTEPAYLQMDEMKLVGTR